MIQIKTPNSIITIINSTKFLSLTLDSNLSWMEHVSELTVKLNKACYTIRAIKPYMSLKVLKTVYFSYFHSVMTYGIIFWGNSHLNQIIFKIQKRIIRIIANKGKRESYRNLYKQLQILTLPSQHIFSLLIFVVRRRNLFVANSEIHNINTRFNQNLHLPSTKLTLVQKGLFYSGSKIYNLLPSYIKSVNNDLNNFKSKLKTLLLENSCCSIDEVCQVISELP